MDKFFPNRRRSQYWWNSKDLRGGVSVCICKPVFWHQFFQLQYKNHPSNPLSAKPKSISFCSPSFDVSFEKYIDLDPK